MFQDIMILSFHVDLVAFLELNIHYLVTEYHILLFLSMDSFSPEKNRPANLWNRDFHSSFVNKPNLS